MRKIFKHFLFVTVCFVCFINLNSVEANDFTINAKSITINEGESYSLCSKKDGIKFYSYNNNVAKVNQNGDVYGNNAGNTKVYARQGGNRLFCSVKVVKPVINLKQNNITLFIGDGDYKTKNKLRPVVKGAKKTYSTSVEDYSVISISKSNEITPLKEGKTKVYISANGINRYCAVNVVKTNISLSDEKITLCNSRDKDFNSVILRVEDIVGPNKSVKWSSSDKNVAKVKNGRVTAISEGKTVITVQANGATACCEVTVVPENDLFFKHGNISMYEGCSMPCLVSNNDAILESSDNNIVSVDGTILNAKKEGCCILTAMKDGRTSTTKVTVNNLGKSISMNTIYIKPKNKNTKYALNIKINSPEKVEFESSNNSVVSIDKKGTLTLKQPGESSITIKCGEAKAVVRVVVDEFISDLDLKYKELYLFAGSKNKFKFKPKVTGRAKTVSYNSSDHSVVVADKIGNISALNRGYSIVKASANGITKECLVTVDNSDILFDKNVTFIKPGEKMGIAADIIGPSQKAKYMVSNKKIAVINKGKIIGKAQGETTLTVKANGIIKTHKLIVGECDHDFEESIITNPTCKDPGESKYKCKLCDYEYSDITHVNKDNHGSNIDNIYIIEPTCTTQGEEYSVCLDCNRLIQKHVVDKLGHDCEWIESNGIEYKKCKRCNAVVNIKPVGAPEKPSILDVDIKDNINNNDNHDNPNSTDNSEMPGYPDYFDDSDNIDDDLHIHIYNKSFVVLEPTCAVDGMRYDICACGDIKSEILPKLGHAYEDDYVIDVEATCEIEGSKSIHCSRCGEKKDIKNIAKGHVYDGNYKCKYCKKYKPGFYKDGILKVVWEDANIDIVKDYTLKEIKEEEILDTDIVYKKNLDGITVEHTPDEHAYAVMSKISDITRVVIPENVTSIGKYAFAFCDNLKEIYIPDTIKEIPEGAFIGCSSVNTISFGNEVESINENAFGDCINLSEFIINNISYKNIELIFELFKKHGINIDSTAFNGANSINNHNYGEWIINQNTDCEHPGMQYRICKDCNYEQLESINPLGHDWQESTVDISANCISMGVETRKCSRCTSVKDLKIIPALGHVRSDWIAVKEPTCTFVGSKIIQCLRCQEKLDEDYIDALGHEFVLQSTLDPTCNGYGNKHYICTRCTETNDSAINPLGHVPRTEVTENYIYPKCDEPGGYDTVKYCDRCDVELIRIHTVIPALGHDYGEFVVDIPQTCTTNGEKSKYCSRCSNRIEVTSIPMYGHDFNKPSKRVKRYPTCIVDGEYYYDCSRCGDDSNETYTYIVAKLGHEYMDEYTTDISPTCVANGSKSRHCIRCSEKKDVAIISALGHDYGDYIVDVSPTCTANGLKSKHCTRCIEKTDVTVIYALGHEYGKFIEKRAATCTTDGLKVRYCTRCNDSDEEVIASMGHKGVYGGKVDCHTKCSICSITLSNKHNYKTSVKKASCLESGINKYVCECGYKYEVTIPALGHDYSMDTGLCTYCKEKHPDALIISWDEPLATGGEYLNDLSIAELTPSAHKNYEHTGKQIAYYRLDGTAGIANPYIKGQIAIKKGTKFRMQMGAGPELSERTESLINIDGYVVSNAQDKRYLNTLVCTIDFDGTLQKMKESYSATANKWQLQFTKQ